jgi:hypothetical protein
LIFATPFPRRVVPVSSLATWQSLLPMDPRSTRWKGSQSDRRWSTRWTGELSESTRTPTTDGARDSSRYSTERRVLPPRSPPTGRESRDSRPPPRPSSIRDDDDPPRRPIPPPGCRGRPRTPSIRPVAPAPDRRTRRSATDPPPPPAHRLPAPAPARSRRTPRRPMSGAARRRGGILPRERPSPPVARRRMLRETTNGRCCRPRRVVGPPRSSSGSTRTPPQPGDGRGGGWRHRFRREDAAAPWRIRDSAPPSSCTPRGSSRTRPSSRGSYNFRRWVVVRGCSSRRRP